MQKINLSQAREKSYQNLAQVEFLAGTGLGRFQIKAYTGAVVDRYWGKLSISVDGIQAKANLPIFRNHNQSEIVGFSEKTWTDGSFFVSGKFSNTTEAAKEVRKLAAEGFPWQASIGVKPVEIFSLESGKQMTVNGNTVTGPAEIWTKSEVFETSFVPLGADSDTSVQTFHNGGAKTLESKARAEWDRDSSLRMEFDGDFEAFKAYFEANNKGLCKSYGVGGLSKYCNGIEI